MIEYLKCVELRNSNLKSSIANLKFFAPQFFNHFWKIRIF